MRHDNIQGATAPVLGRVDHAGLAALGTAAVGPAGLIPPNKDEPPGVQAEGFRGQEQDDRPDSPPAPAEDQAGATDTERLAALRARLALAGWTLSRTTTNTARVHTLLFDACRCGAAGRLRCLACWRWHRHYLTVTLRRKAWGTAR